MLKDMMFACALLASAVSITIGVWEWSRPAGLIVAGLLFAGWAWLVLADEVDQ